MMEMLLSPCEENINRLVAQLWQPCKDVGIWTGSLTADGRFPFALISSPTATVSLLIHYDSQIIFCGWFDSAVSEESNI